MMPDILKLTHANLERELYVYKHNLAGFHLSKAQDCTHLYTIGNVVYPVKETPEQILKLITVGGNSERRNNNTIQEPEQPGSSGSKEHQG